MSRKNSLEEAKREMARVSAIAEKNGIDELARTCACVVANSYMYDADTRFARANEMAARYGRSFTREQLDLALLVIGCNKVFGTAANLRG